MTKIGIITQNSLLSMCEYKLGAQGVNLENQTINLLCNPFVTGSNDASFKSVRAFEGAEAAMEALSRLLACACRRVRLLIFQTIVPAL